MGGGVEFCAEAKSPGGARAFFVAHTIHTLHNLPMLYTAHCTPLARMVDFATTEERGSQAADAFHQLCSWELQTRVCICLPGAGRCRPRGFPGLHGHQIFFCIEPDESWQLTSRSQRETASPDVGVPQNRWLQKLKVSLACTHDNMLAGGRL